MSRAHWSICTFATILLAGIVSADEPPAAACAASPAATAAPAEGASAAAAPQTRSTLSPAQIKRLNDMADEAAAVLAPGDKEEQIRVKLDLMAAIGRNRARQQAAGHLAKVKELLEQAEDEARLALSLGADASELPQPASVLRQGEPTPAAPRDATLPPGIPDLPGGNTNASSKDSLPFDEPPIDPATPVDQSPAIDPPLQAPTPADEPPPSPETAQAFFSDPVWLANMDALMGEVGPDAVAPRIVGIPGSVRPTTDVMDCVYIGIAPGGGRGACLCTGTLIAPRIVVTAAHCVTAGPKCTGNATHIYVCNDVSASNKRRFDVQRTVRHPQYSGAPSYRNDIALLLLAEPVTGVSARKFATATEINSAKGFLAMGFGRNNANQTGTKMEGYVATRSASCAPPANSQFGCFPGENLIAGGYGYGGGDSCNGDSGGPCFYMGKDKRLYLAGLTSRGLPGLPCGGGGCYVRVDHHQAWIKEKMKELGATQVEIDYITDGQKQMGEGR